MIISLKLSYHPQMNLIYPVEFVGFQLASLHTESNHNVIVVDDVHSQPRAGVHDQTVLIRDIFIILRMDRFQNQLTATKKVI